MKANLLCFAVAILAVSSLGAQVTTPGGGTQAMAREARVKADINTLAPVGKSSTVTGELVTRPGKKPEISLGNGKVLPVENAASVEKLPQGAKFQFEVSPTQDGTAVNVGKSALNALAGWEKSKTMLASDDFKPLHIAYKKLDDSLKTMTTTGAMGVSDPAFQEKVEEVHTELVKASQQPQAQDPVSRKEITERFAQVRDLRRKAVYGRVDNYRRDVYKRIYDFSGSAVAIARRGMETPEASGVLIGNSLVLTCRHVAKIFTSKDQMRVWFDYEETSEGLKKICEFEVEEVIMNPVTTTPGDEPLDFALLLLKPRADDKFAHDLYEPAILSDGEPARDDPIYVAGHPARQRKQVHDNSFVLFPYHASQDQMAELRLIVDDEISNSPNKAAELKQFVDSYKALPSGVFEQHSLRWYGSPVLAADCDTSHGNSGSGAWNRRSNTLIGILFAGEDDVAGESYSAGWRRHEAILPISVIMTEIGKWKAAEWKTDKWKSDWIVDFNVKVK